MKALLILSVLLAASASGACTPVTGDRILGRDLALADPRFSAMPAATQIAFTPMPGSTRTFTTIELQRIARANGIAFADASELCFEVPLYVPTDADFVESLRRSLPQGANLSLVDRGRAAIPHGKIEFPVSGLEPPASGNDGAQLWRGFVQYTETRRIAVWARVNVSLTYTAVIAKQDIAADTPIESGFLIVETRTGPLNLRTAHLVPATRIEEVAGRVLQRPLKAGNEIPLSLIDDPPAVRKGDVVSVEVQSGLALLRFQAIAQTTARTGEIAELLNPISGKLFRARIGTGSKALIVVGKAPTL